MTRDRWRSTNGDFDSQYTATRPVTRIATRSALSEASARRKPPRSPATAVTSPTLPNSISAITIRRRTGCETTASDSLVVKPTPLNAERAWNRAIGRVIPVTVSATVATLVMNSEIRATTTSRITASIPSGLPDRVRWHASATPACAWAPWPGPVLLWAGTGLAPSAFRPGNGMPAPPSPARAGAAPVRRVAPAPPPHVVTPVERGCPGPRRRRAEREPNSTMVADGTPSR